jgi:hypothetical protein
VVDVVAVMVVLAAVIITSIILVVTALVITAITLSIVTPVVAIVATIVVASVIAVVVATIITPIPIVVATIGSAVKGNHVDQVDGYGFETLVTILVVVVVALGLLGFRGYSKGTLQLFTLPHGMFSAVVELALVVHDHVEVTFEECGRSWWICHVSFTRPLSRHVSSIAVIFSVEVVHHCVLSVN